MTLADIEEKIEDALHLKNPELLLDALSELEAFIDTTPVLDDIDNAIVIEENAISRAIKENIIAVDELDDFWDRVVARKTALIKPKKVAGLAAVVKRLMKKGLSFEAAREEAVRRELRRKGYFVCAICGGIIDPETEEFIRAGKKSYHVRCFERLKHIEDKPLKRNGKFVICEMCGKVIYQGLKAGGFHVICPPGESVIDSPHCRFFHHECYIKYLRETISK